MTTTTTAAAATTTLQIVDVPVYSGHGRVLGAPETQLPAEKENAREAAEVKELEEGGCHEGAVAGRRSHEVQG